MGQMTFGSLCSGAGLMDLGIVRAGWRCAFHCEIDADARRILAHHWPETECHEDITKLDPNALPAVTLLAGGTPCQDWSVAGRRAGLAGKRSGLFFEFVRIADALAPLWILWENVFGLLSQHEGKDFATVLGQLSGYTPEVPKDGWRSAGVCLGSKRAVAWRVLDAKYVGGCALHGEPYGVGPVPQTRRRVFVVARARDGRGLAGATRGEDAGMLDALPAAVLFEPESCERDLEEGSEEGTQAAATLRSRSHGAGVNPPGRGGEDDHNLIFQANGAGSFRAGAPSLSASDDNGSNQVVVGSLQSHTKRHGHAMTTQQAAEEGHIVAMQCHGSNVGPMGTLRKGNGGLTGGVPFVVHAAESCAKEDHAYEAEVARSLDSTGGFACAQGGTVVSQPFNIVGMAQQGGNHAYPTDTAGCMQHKGLCPTGNEAGTVVAFHVTQDPISGDVAPAMGTGNKEGCATPSVAHPVISFQERGREDGPSLELQEDVAYALTAPASSGRRQEKNICAGMAVRRLTPVECCRLMGAPDDFLDLDPPLSDSAKYRLCGNGCVTFVTQWIADRIARAEQIMRDVLDGQWDE